MMGSRCGISRAISQLALVVIAHAPESAPGCEKKAVAHSGGDGGHGCRDLSGRAGNGLFDDGADSGCAVTQLAFIVGTHSPKAAVGLHKTTVLASGSTR